MRADAARRRQNIITHAKHVFAERGGDVALEAVAAASGVGIATLYRNFPSREDLLRAVVQDTVEQIIRAVDQARRTLDADPAGAWQDLLSSLTAMEPGRAHGRAGPAGRSCPGSGSLSPGTGPAACT